VKNIHHPNLNSPAAVKKGEVLSNIRLECIIPMGRAAKEGRIIVTTEPPPNPKLYTKEKRTSTPLSTFKALFSIYTL